MSHWRSTTTTKVADIVFFFRLLSFRGRHSGSSFFSLFYHQPPTLSHRSRELHPCNFFLVLLFFSFPDDVLHVTPENVGKPRKSYLCFLSFGNFQSIYNCLPHHCLRNFPSLANILLLQITSDTFLHSTLSASLSSPLCYTPDDYGQLS